MSEENKINGLSEDLRQFDDGTIPTPPNTQGLQGLNLVTPKLGREYDPFSGSYKDAATPRQPDHQDPRLQSTAQKTPHQRVCEMNVAFGNAKGDKNHVDYKRVHKQCLNIADEYGELMIALGGNPDVIKAAVAHMKAASRIDYFDQVKEFHVRDALCDIKVFADGAHHFLGRDGDVDMHAVIDGVMTRFIKTPEDEQATLTKHGITDLSTVYFEGEYPTKVMKAAIDLPDAPAGKFMKSASFKEPVFPE